MSQQPEKSPLPWSVVPPEIDGSEVINGASLHDANGRSIYTVDCGDCNMLDEPTAEFIARACNNHEALIVVAHWSLARLVSVSDLSDEQSEAMQLQRALRAAIAKAEGVPHVTA